MTSRLLWLLTVGALAYVAAMAASGCSHPPEDTVVLEERAGGVVADLLTKLNGDAPVDAVTVPRPGGGAVVVFLRPAAAGDVCLEVHERTHVAQIVREGDDWLWSYLGEHVRRGYERNRYEMEARAAQARCELEEVPALRRRPRRVERRWVLVWAGGGS